MVIYYVLEWKIKTTHVEDGKAFERVKSSDGVEDKGGKMVLSTDVGDKETKLYGWETSV